MAVQLADRRSPRGGVWRWLKYLLLPVTLLAGLACAWPALHARYLARQIEARGGFSWLSSEHKNGTTPTATSAKPSHLKQWRDAAYDFFTDRLIFCNLVDDPVDSQFVSSICATGTLTTLALDGTEVDDSVAPLLGSNSELTLLSLAHTQITGASLEHFQGLSKLTFLDLECTDVRNDDLRFLTKLSSLEQLYLSETPISSGGIRHLSTLAKLTDLEIYGTAVNDDAMEILAKLPLLGMLDVGKCPITDRGLAYLAQSSSISHINLEETAISAKGFNSLLQLRMLKEISLSRQHILHFKEVNFARFANPLKIGVDCCENDLDAAEADVVRKLEEGGTVVIGFNPE